MRVRGTAILLALVVAAVAAASCADIKRMVGRPGKPVATSSTPRTLSAADLAAAAKPDTRPDQAIEPKGVKGSGRFIVEEQATLSAISSRPCVAALRAINSPDRCSASTPNMSLTLE